MLAEQLVDGMGAKRLPGHESPTHPGVVMLFPLTILAPNAWGFSVSILDPVDVETTLMRVLNWAPKSTWPGLLDFSNEASFVRLDDREKHPLESGNFQLKDMWICEKIQRNLRSPKFEVGPLADGPGAEGSITHFQRSVLDHLDAAGGRSPAWR